MASDVKLRTGITTGTCAAAAAKACALYLRYASCPDYVSVRNPEGHVFNVNVFREGDSFGVIKDSGDDICDITNGVKVLVNLEIIHGHNEIIFAAGQGVGTVMRGERTHGGGDGEDAASLFNICSI